MLRLKKTRILKTIKNVKGMVGSAYARTMEIKIKIIFSGTSANKMMRRLLMI